ncbi:MAG: hypothetical protein Q9183_003589 [Haloplaca sp. 2 TL-2023]
MATAQVSLPLLVLPESWSAPNDFKAIGSLSTANQRNLEPVGPHFLAHARRKRHKRTFSEDERIQAQENVKKTEDDDVGDISEPENELMLGRDAKDWKTTTPSSASQNTATVPPTPKSNVPTAKKSSVITPTNVPQPVPLKTTPSSNAFKKPLKSSPTPSNAANTTPSTKTPTSTLPPKKRPRNPPPHSTNSGAPSSKAKLASAKPSLFPYWVTTKARKRKWRLFTTSGSISRVGAVSSIRMRMCRMTMRIVIKNDMWSARTIMRARRRRRRIRQG